ncbi:cytochrome C oxidase subunit IV family protein [Natronobacterium texcoconense]|uniref:Cytochrome C oxidase subunit IV n=1 Tax=Natronobacterium texcoconense TaxID=1095778 RepID=A0A1H1J4I4_NATTX|nr:cytochrome C oxidase subunit IV family protein [Natronobacterium texcoconense]SDR44700.1 Cytochrome C oxidase subunit IV [Natronobacterium texcoconense]
MADVRTYALIYVVLLVLGTGKFVFFTFDFAYATAMGATILLAIAKAGLIAGYYQHLIEEPRAVSYMMGVALFMVFLLTVAAGYSIQ